MKPYATPGSREAKARIASKSWRKTTATTWVVRFEPERDLGFVRVHVQSTATGGLNYNAAASVSSTEYDCRATRIRDVTVTVDGVSRFHVWLIPVVGGIKYDGGTGNGPDCMDFVDLGV